MGQLSTYIIPLIIIPFLFSFWIARWPVRSKTAWVCMLLGYGSFFVLIWSIGAWGQLFYPLRWAFPIVFLLAAVTALPRLQKLPGKPGGDWKDLAHLILNVALFIGFGGLAGAARGGSNFDGEAVELDFPLRSGNYVIVQGGDDVLINHHNPDPSQRYALDIVRLESFGLRSRGIIPGSLEDYSVWGDTVCAPCAGEVLAAVSDLPDHEPPARDEENPAGNHVVIRCEEGKVDVYLAHLMRGSVSVSVGEEVTSSRPIGLTGNSGNSTEPHLHIHAERDRPSGEFSGGHGVAITFNGRFLVKNDLVRVSGTGYETPLDR